jgi:hypothetical protein
MGDVIRHRLVQGPKWRQQLVKSVTLFVAMAASSPAQLPTCTSRHEYLSNERPEPRPKPSLLPQRTFPFHNQDSRGSEPTCDGLVRRPGASDSMDERSQARIRRVVHGLFLVAVSSNRPQVLATSHIWALSGQGFYSLHERM